jgi:hypothetical protein
MKSLRIVRGTPPPSTKEPVPDPDLAAICAHIEQQHALLLTTLLTAVTRSYVKYTKDMSAHGDTLRPVLLQRAIDSMSRLYVTWDRTTGLAVSRRVRRAYEVSEIDEPQSRLDYNFSAQSYAAQLLNWNTPSVHALETSTEMSEEEEYPILSSIMPLHSYISQEDRITLLEGGGPDDDLRYTYGIDEAQPGFDTHGSITIPCTSRYPLRPVGGAVYRAAVLTIAYALLRHARIAAYAPTRFTKFTNRIAPTGGVCPPIRAPPLTC